MSKVDSEVDNKKMPIDQYGRYNAVSKIIKQLMQDKKQTKVTILDLGGFKGEIHKFFKKSEASITIIDIYDCDDENYVKGSALDLPFENDSFDYVVSFEVFEHIDRKDRATFIKEGKRVSRGAFILTAPFSGADDEVLQSEIYVNDLWKKIHKQNHQWLHEHITYRTPKTEEIEKILNDQKIVFKKLGNNDLILWNLMLSFSSFTTLFEPTGRNPEIQLFYNENSEVLDSNTDHFYRYIYVMGADSKIAKLPKKTDTSIEKKTEVVSKLISLLFMKMSRDVLKDRKWRQGNFEKVVVSKDQEIQLLNNKAAASEEELYNVLHSKTWRYSRKVAGLKRSITRK